MRRKLACLSVAGLLVGCGPDYYRQSADRQVEALIRDREQRTLDYEPQAESPVTVSTTPPKQAYARLPTTPIPPATQPAFEPARETLRAGVLGPETRWMELPPVEDEPELAPAESYSPDSLTYGPRLPAPAEARLDLFGSLQYAIQNSRAYKDQMDELYLTALNVTLQRHLFGPRPFAQVTYGYAGGQADAAYRSALTATANAGVRQKLPYGGEVVASTLVQFVDAINGNVADGESASVALSGSVPLLRGAGLVNLEPLINSERQLVYQIRAFEDYRRSFVLGIATQYFSLLTQQQNVESRRVNLANTTALIERTQALFAAGRISFLEVQRSAQAQLVGLNTLRDAEDAYKSVLDDFKVTIGMPVEENLEVVPIEINAAVPQVADQEAVQLAYRYRLDLQSDRDRIEDAQRQVQVAASGLLPGLDLTAAAQVGNRPFTPAAQVDGRSLDYSAGVTLDLPIDRVAERNIYRAALVRLQEAQRGYEQSMAEVTANVRDALRGIRNAESTLDIQRRGIELAQRRYEFSSELLKQGRISARDVLEAQTSLLDAQVAYARARSSLQVRILEYLRNTGTLRVDPHAGELGFAMDRAALQSRPAEDRSNGT